MLPKGYRTIIDWFQEVNLDPDYANPTFQRIEFEDDDDEEEKPLSGGVELNRIEEVVEDEETDGAGEKLKAESKVDAVKDDAEKVGETKGDENKKPGEEGS